MPNPRPSDYKSAIFYYYLVLFINIKTKLKKQSTKCYYSIVYNFILVLTLVTAKNKKVPKNWELHTSELVVKHYNILIISVWKEILSR